MLVRLLRLFRVHLLTTFVALKLHRCTIGLSVLRRAEILVLRHKWFGRFSWIALTRRLPVDRCMLLLRFR
jgi:hypothetical protein